MVAAVERYLPTTDIHVMSTSSAARAEHSAISDGSAPTPSSRRTTKRTRARVAPAVGLVVGAMLIPFLDHTSTRPTVFTYSIDYVAFLALLLVAAVVIAQSLAFLGNAPC